jgi:hypothetical protein
MRRAAHAAESKAGRPTPPKARPWSASKSPPSHARPCLGCAVELVLRVAPLRRGVPSEIFCPGFLYNYCLLGTCFPRGRGCLCSWAYIYLMQVAYLAHPVKPSRGAIRKHMRVKNKQTPGGFVWPCGMRPVCLHRMRCCSQGTERERGIREGGVA